MNNILKTILIGASTTGKTTIVNRMKYNTFNSAVSCTVGVSFSRLLHNNINYELWDTAGQERYAPLLPMYFRNSKILIFVFDVSDASSLNTIDNYIKVLNSLDNLNNYKIIIVGNKIDLITENEVANIKDIIKKKFENSTIIDKIYDYIFVSAKTGVNFDIFMDQLDRCAISINNSDNVTTNIVKLDNEPKNKKSCYC